VVVEGESPITTVDNMIPAGHFAPALVIFPRKKKHED
jgi:hypothetical protein